ncbi:hypothetical protein KR018_006502 [Drosophila ironensis]|nr:hypothetical protein KR018_006502 [Drosophila ironensis]
MAKPAEVEKLVQQSNCLLPDLTIRHSDLSSPKEPILTRIFVQYLRAFGFRVEPTHNLDNEMEDKSREKRLFLIRLCRQIERILQISFPNKTYGYPDLINPTCKKTLNTLEYLFNYLAYYKQFKKNVLGPADECLRRHDALLAELNAKTSQLEQRQAKAASVKDDLEKCQAQIEELAEQLRLGHKEQAQKKKPLLELAKKMESLEQQDAELSKRIALLQQQTVNEGQVVELKQQIQGTRAHIESCKSELAGKQQILEEHRDQIEANQQMVAEIVKAMATLPPQVIEEYKKQCKQMEAAEKEMAQLKISEQNERQMIEEKLQEIQDVDKLLQNRKTQLDDEERALGKQVEERKAAIEDLERQQKKQEKANQELEMHIENEEQMHALLGEQISEILGEDWLVPEEAA